MTYAILYVTLDYNWKLIITDSFSKFKNYLNDAYPNMIQYGKILQLLLWTMYYGLRCNIFKPFFLEL